MTTTGWADTFGRTVASGFGVATSGQTYGVTAPTTQFSVTPNTASIAISAAGNPMGILARQTSDIDVTGQVALGAIPASNLATVGFVAKATGASNCYVGTLMVATGGAMSLRLSKIIAGGLTTLATVALGTTYIANTFYNLRYVCYWSTTLQTNVMQLKLWAVGATQPGGWQATFNTDASLTQYTAGVQAGLYARDESTTVGTITAKFQNVAAVTYSLPEPGSADPMCHDPAVVYPQQAALQSLAVAADAAMSTIDPLTSLAGLFPRVRVSLSNVVLPAGFFVPVSFAAVEFNVGTPTNLGYNPLSIYLPVGIWLISFELRLVDAAVMSQMQVSLNGPSVGSAPSSTMRTNTSLLNDLSAGGTTRLAATAYSTDPTTPAQVSVSIFPANTAVAYTVNYAALSAIKISDYF